ncbi:MAG: glycosyltransferase family 2 protein [Bacteroidota bacterium]
MKFSIIVPVYNVEAFLPKCLNSILKQSFRDFEVLVINDQTPDNSQVLIDEFATKDKRIVPIKHDVNQGLGGARNTGISLAKGSYLLFVDSDDWIAEDALMILSKYIEEKKIDIIKFGFVEIYPTRQVDSPTLNEGYSKNGWNLIKEEIQDRAFSPICCRSLYKRSFLEENKIHFPENVHFEDFSFTIKTHLLSKGICSIKDHLYFYRKDRDGSIMHKPSPRDIEVCTTLEIIYDFTTSDHWTTVAEDPIFNYQMYEWSAGTTIYRYLKNNSDQQLKKELIKELRNNFYFRYYLKKASDGAGLNVIRKIPPYLLLHNLMLFKIFYKVYRLFLNQS